MYTDIKNVVRISNDLLSAQHLTNDDEWKIYSPYLARRGCTELSIILPWVINPSLKRKELCHPFSSAYRFLIKKSTKRKKQKKKEKEKIRKNIYTGNISKVTQQYLNSVRKHYIVWLSKCRNDRRATRWQYPVR